jgi:glycosyltransferase involved in cell wall biosynthesis
MLSTLPAVSEAGIEVLVATPAGGPLEDALLECGVTRVDCRVTGRDGARRPLPELRQDLARIVEQVRPDLVHANSLSVARVSGPTMAAARVPSIGHLRDIIKLSERVVADVNCHRRLIAVSAATRDYHGAQGIDAAKCVAIHNGVDLQTFCPRASTGYLRRDLGLPRDARLIATIGQIGLRKGMDVLLATALQTVKEFPDVHWLVVGERTSEKDESIEFERRLHELAAETSLAGRVHFLGQRSDIAALLNECTILVHTARQEPLSRVLLEASASGAPIIATDVGGTREIFPSEAEGAVLVPRDDHEGLATAMIGLLRDDTRREALGRAARRRAEAAFDVRAASARLIAEYQALI